MARIIPSILSPHVKSDAERKIFQLFLEADGTDNWVVLHSLGLTEVPSAIYGEIDFVVLAPGLGLFALEVKGGQVSRRGGSWEYRDRFNRIGIKHRSPFDQAREAVFSIVKEVRRDLDPAFTHLDRLFFAYGVLFPDIEYQASGPDEEAWQIFDANQQDDFQGYIQRLSRGAAQKYEETFGYPVPFEGKLGKREVDYIANKLRGDFDRPLALRIQVQQAQEQRARLTEEQYRCIDHNEENPRVLIRGGAGTGKTLIAIQEAVVSAVRGERAALFCFNKNLGQWLGRQFQDPALTPAYVGTFHAFLVELLEKNGVDFEIPSDARDLDFFFKERLPELALPVIRNRFEPLDLLILDEAQDLISDTYLDLFDALLDGGLKGGRWRFFGDFSKQAIYSGTQTGEDLLDLLDRRAHRSTYSLKINCRNPKPVCQAIHQLTGFPLTNENWMKIEGPEVQYLTYAEEEEGVRHLDQLLTELRRQGIRPDKITILSRVRRENSIVRHLQNHTIENYCAGGNETVSFSTIHSFKGLENSIIILTDIHSYRDSQLIYVGFSRAVAGLYVIEHKNAREEYRVMETETREH